LGQRLTGSARHADALAGAQQPGRLPTALAEELDGWLARPRYDAGRQVTALARIWHEWV
jgi:hypothetical protein